MGFKSYYHAKKAFEPISALNIYAPAIQYAVEGIMLGFFGAIGVDAYNKLKDHFSKPRSKERLLILNPVIIDGNSRKMVEIILTNLIDIEDIFVHGMSFLDPIIEENLLKKSNISSIVIDYKAGSPQVLYSIRDDGVPSVIKPIPEDQLSQMSLSVDGYAELKE